MGIKTTPGGQGSRLASPEGRQNRKTNLRPLPRPECITKSSGPNTEGMCLGGDSNPEHLFCQIYSPAFDHWTILTGKDSPVVKSWTIYLTKQMFWVRVSSQTHPFGIGA